jgi:hypothetical protein
VSNQILFRRGHFIVERSFGKNGVYYTIVNTKRSRHSHAYRDELTAAIMICKNAYRGKIPKDYPEWMQESIRRILDDK